MSQVLLKAMLSVTRGPSCDHRHPVNSYFVAKSKILQASSLYTFYALLTLLSVSLSCSFFAFLISPVTVIMGRHGTPSPHVLVLGHSFIRRLRDFIECNPRVFRFNVKITESAAVSWQGLGGCPVLHVVQSVRPDIVIVQLGTNNLSFRSPLLVGFILRTSSTCYMIHTAFSLYVYATLFVVVRPCHVTNT